MSAQISVNHEQSLFVIPSGDGFSCFSFENAKAQTEHIARALNRDDLLPTDAIYATLEGYALYLKAVQAWGNSTMSNKTWFYPGTEKAVQSVLEACRKSRKLVRLFFGDPVTGRDNCEEWEVVGHVGRSIGVIKVPLLVPQGEFGGCSIKTDRVLRIMDVLKNTDIYRHPKYEQPSIRIAPISDAQYPHLNWAGYRDDELIARFPDVYEAAEWAEFITGRIAAKRDELLTKFKLAA